MIFNGFVLQQYSEGNLALLEDREATLIKFTARSSPESTSKPEEISSPKKASSIHVKKTSPKAKDANQRRAAMASRRTNLGQNKV